MIATLNGTLTTPSAPNADTQAIAAILAATLPAGHPYIVCNSDPLARLVPLTDAQLEMLKAERRATEAAEYERLTRRARRHPNGIRNAAARRARSRAWQTAHIQWVEQAYWLRRANAEALLAAAGEEVRIPICPDCGEPLVRGGNWAGADDYLCGDCYAVFEEGMQAFAAALCELVPA